MRDPVQAGVAHDRPAGGGRVVVGDVDHGVQDRVAGRVDVTLAASIETTEVGDQQHRLDDAPGHERAVEVDAREPALGVDDGERRATAAGGQRAFGAGDGARARVTRGKRAAAGEPPARASRGSSGVGEGAVARRVEAGAEAIAARPAARRWSAPAPRRGSAGGSGWPAWPQSARAPRRRTASARWRRPSAGHGGERPRSSPRPVPAAGGELDDDLAGDGNVEGCLGVCQARCRDPIPRVAVRTQPEREGAASTRDRGGDGIGARR